MPEVYHVDQLPLFPLAKTCSKCHIEKPLENFYKSQTGKDGYENRCKQCRYRDERTRKLARRPARIKSVKPVKIKRARTPQDPLLKLERKHTHQRTYYATHREKLCADQRERRRIRAEKRQAERITVHVRDGYKICANCRQEKPVDEFYKSSQAKDGCSYSCKECRDKASKHREIGKLRSRFNQTVSPGHKWCHGCQQEKPVEQFWADRTKKDGRNTQCIDCRTVSRQTYWEENRERLTQKRREWYSKPENKLKILEHNRRRLGHIFTDDPVDYGRILERDGAWCYICESLILPEHAIEFDHVVPLVPPKRSNREPGTHTEDNIKVSHKVCNRRKHNRLLEEMTPYQRRGV